MLEKVSEIMALALVVWCLSTTIATAKVFESFRDWIFPTWAQDQCRC